MNQLYYGDNLDILRRYVKDASVDLVYLDPPFQSGRDYNVLFERHDSTKAAAQIRAFKDTWEWSAQAESAYLTAVKAGGELSRMMQAMRQVLGQSDMMAYLCMMAPRLVELRRILRREGSLYLHCDPTASHYLKLLLDAVFGPRNFFSEIIWQRYGSHGDSKRYGAVHDIVLYYGKGPQAYFSKQFIPYTDEYAASRFRHIDEAGRRYQEQNLSSPSPRPNLKYPYTASNGITYQPHRNGWKCELSRMQQLDREGRLHFPKSPNGRLRLKMFLDEAEGVALQDVWTDITFGASSKERLGYPTQKPLALLERIIASSCPEGGVVLDPFCGCGTAVHAAQTLGRNWLGIDITCLATHLIKSRMKEAFGVDICNAVGEPVSLSEARNLAGEDRFQFQCWALGFVGARSTETKKGADKGIDGRLYFHADPASGTTQQIIFSVKSGQLKAPDLRDLRGVVHRENAELGVLITLEEPTSKMRAEAASAGFYDSPWGSHPRLQILTVAELLKGQRVDYPPEKLGGVKFQKPANDQSRATGTHGAGPGVAKAKSDRRGRQHHPSEPPPVKAKRRAAK